VHSSMSTASGAAPARERPGSQAVRYASTSTASRKSAAVEGSAVAPSLEKCPINLGGKLSMSHSPNGTAILDDDSGRRSKFFLAKMGSKFFGGNTAITDSAQKSILAAKSLVHRASTRKGTGMWLNSQQGGLLGSARGREAWGPGGAGGASRGADTPQFGETIGGSSGASAVGGSLPRRRQFVNERCSRCTMEAVWAACDVFWEFDVAHTGQISRPEYILRLSEPPNVMRLRMLRRSRLENRFRDSAQPVTMEEFLRLLWPAAKDRDFVLMRRWSELREAHSIGLQDNFRGTEPELSRMFHYLVQGEGRINAYDIVRSQVLGLDEVHRVLKTSETSADLRQHLVDKETFKSAVWPEVKQKFIQAETLARMKREEESLNNSFAGAFNMGADKK